MKIDNVEFILVQHIVLFKVSRVYYTKVELHIIIVLVGETF